MSPTSEREKRNVIDRASVLAGLSVALWERMRGAKLRFGGEHGARSKASVAGEESESRRWNCVPKALRELWERDGNETGTRRKTRIEIKRIPWSRRRPTYRRRPACLSGCCVCAPPPQPRGGRRDALRYGKPEACATGAAGNSTGSFDDIPSRLGPHGTPPPRNLTEFSKRRRSTPLLCVRSSSSRTSNHARRFGPTA